jgi:hypothetical protein
VLPDGAGRRGSDKGRMKNILEGLYKVEREKQIPYW